MNRAAVVVRATSDGISIRQTPREDSFEYAEGDVGVLLWEWHKEDMQYLRPVVIWDKDASRQPRGVHFGTVTPIGIQQDGCRFYANSN